MRIWFPNPLGDEVVDGLQAMLPDHEVDRSAIGTEELLIEGRPTAEQLASCPNLRWVVIPFAGAPAATIGLVRDRPEITLYNLHYNATATAELALALILAASKQIVPMDQALRNHDWRPRYAPDQAIQLAGRSALILGYGEVGRRVGAMLRGMGMTVSGIRRHPSSPDEFGPDRLAERLALADLLVITAPLTKETEGMIDAEALAALPPGAILVNVGRAQIVNEQALYDALVSGRLHSAGLDVWYRYPQAEAAAVPGYFSTPFSAANSPPSNLPFGELANVVMSPHRGGATRETETERARGLAALIEAIWAGTPPSPVDLDLGY